MQFRGKNKIPVTQNHTSPKTTSWGGVADWYGEHLEGGDTYHAQVVAPNIRRIVSAKHGMKILDIGCGEGYFTRLFAEDGALVEGADIAPELIAKARTQSPAITFHVSSAQELSFANDHSFDVVTCVLALQNIERIEAVFKEVSRVLTPKGRFVCVINHPTFRIPKHSSWGWDESNHSQYRRVDRYLSATKAEIDMHPGEGSKDITYSFHRSIQDYSKAFAGAGFVITKIEEWISHRVSEKGPRKIEEDRVRKEFPLFMCIEVRKVSNRE